MCKVVYMKTSGHTSVVDYCLLFTVDVSTQGISYPRSVHPDRIFIGSRVCHRLEFWDVFQASRDTKRLLSILCIIVPSILVRVGRCWSARWLVRARPVPRDCVGGAGGPLLYEQSSIWPYIYV